MPLDPSTPVGSAVKFTGGRYNGLHGVLHKACDSVCSVYVLFENTPHEIVEDRAHLSPRDPIRIAVAPEAPLSLSLDPPLHE